MIKMDFLGLKELKVISKTFEAIEKRHGIKLTLDSIKFDDPKTYELFSMGATIGVFQFSMIK